MQPGVRDPARGVVRGGLDGGQGVGEEGSLRARQRRLRGEPGGARLDDAAEEQDVVDLGVGADRAVGERGETGADDDGAAGAAAARRHQAGLAQRGDRVAQGGPADLEPLGELALGRQPLARPEDPQPDGGREVLDGRLEGVAVAHGAQDGVRQVGRHAHPTPVPRAGPAGKLPVEDHYR